LRCAEGDAQRLLALLRATPWLMRALQAGAALGLPSWAIGAGALRNRVWDHLHGFAAPTPLADLDFIYFDAEGRTNEAQIERRLRQACPELPWEVCNQAGVHLWLRDDLGQPVPPLRSLQEGVASWPETATALAVWLDRDGQLRLIAPFGLADLFGLRLRHNPARASLASYLQRLVEKRWTERWPLLEVQD
jgi:hypothetical protein